VPRRCSRIKSLDVLANIGFDIYDGTRWLSRAVSGRAGADKAARTGFLLLLTTATFVGAGFCWSLLGCGQPVAAWRGGHIDLHVC
jgi:hypothetical protein